jgi:hypothetical protein
VDPSHKFWRRPWAKDGKLFELGTQWSPSIAPPLEAPTQNFHISRGSPKLCEFTHVYTFKTWPILNPDDHISHPVTLISHSA